MEGDRRLVIGVVRRGAHSERVQGGGRSVKILTKFFSQESLVPSPRGEGVCGPLDINSFNPPWAKSFVHNELRGVSRFFRDLYQIGQKSVGYR